MHRQQGYFLVLSVVLILSIGVLGILIAYTFSNRARISVAEQQGMQAFYMAESGLEMASRMITMPNLSGTPTRITCASVTGTGALTNAAISSGTFTATTINSSPIFATTTLNGALTSSATSIMLTSVSGFAASGRVLIDREAINYAAISSNTLIGVTRGVGGTTASSHASGAGVGEYLCALDVQAGIPSVASPQYKRDLQWNVQLEDAFAVGIAISGSVWNVIHWNRPTEMQWIQQSPAFGSTKQLNAVSVLSNADVWAVGNSASALHYNGSTWTNINTGIAGGDTLQSVSGVSSTEAWACVSQGKVYKWTGGASWTVVTTISGSTLNGISTIDTNGDGSADTGWVVGTKKTAYLYNGSTWTSSSTGITVDLNAVSTLSATDAWAAGLSGSVFKWNGSSWDAISTPTASALNGISMIKSGASDIGWAVGASSTAIYYNGTSWASTTTGLPGGLTLNSVVIASPNQAWTVDSSGHIYKWNGSTWTLIFTSAKGLFGIDIVQNNQPTSGWHQIFH